MIKNEIERIERDVRRVKRNLRVFKIRDKIENKFGDEQITATKHFRDGRLLEELEEILESLFEFNVEAMSKEPISDDMIEVYKMKEKYIKEIGRAHV